MKWREIATNKENWLFAVAQMGSGFLNYLFQILAARQLTSVEFGQWSGWLATFSVTLFVASWIQALATIQKSIQIRLTPVKALVLVAVLSATSGVALTLGIEDVAGWLWITLFSAFFGLALARRQLIVASLCTLIFAFSKFLIVFVFPTYEGFRWAILFCPALATFVGLLLLSRSNAPIPANKTSSKETTIVIFCALFLSLASAWIPQLDLLSAQQLLSAEELGQFAKVALIYKGIFFFLMIAAQVLMTYQLRGLLIRMSFLSLLAIAALGGTIALLLPHVWLFQTLPAAWLSGATLHIVSLSVIFFFVQQETSHQRWKWPALCSAAFILEQILTRWQTPSLPLYWQGSIALELVLIAIYLTANRARS